MEQQQEVKKVHPIQKWIKRDKAETKTMEFNGVDLTFAEMTGSQKDALSKIKKTVNQAMFVWKRCVEPYSPDWHLSDAEFRNAFEFSNKDIAEILEQVMEFNGMTEEGQKMLEKH